MWPDSPDGDDLAYAQTDAVHLGDKDGGNRFVEGSAIHVDGSADRHDEPRDSRVDLIVFLQAAEGNRQSHCTDQTKRWMVRFRDTPDGMGSVKDGIMSVCKITCGMLMNCVNFLAN